MGSNLVCTRVRIGLPLKDLQVSSTSNMTSTGPGSTAFNIVDGQNPAPL